MSSTATSDDEPRPHSSLIFLPADRRYSSSRSVTCDAFSSQSIRRGYQCNTELCKCSPSSHLKDLPKRAQPCQILWQMGDALNKITIEPESELCIIGDLKQLFLNDVLIPIVRGNCDFRVLAASFDPSLTHSLCWVALKLVDFSLQCAVIKFEQINPSVRKSVVNEIMHTVHWQDTPDYDLDHHLLHTYNCELREKAMGNGEHLRYITVLDAMMDVLLDALNRPAVCKEPETSSKRKRSSGSDDRQTKSKRHHNETNA
ncbi:hypothetical protein CYLTODRAFT_495151 [Cylindrobasidium torrendii FP15055 ss-10]|uniref:Uncharacterized protein n=1 Tax=Cylindrobasidium torrendii FP15055 ss-10 TaxID=1314674 RepID=A0A0D7AWG2_9AGAR|nr:hypothetical protein CYLTODRAFT_495151 [Cylindrobasidium torrendii FP15055 ss-10]